MEFDWNDGWILMALYGAQGKEADSLSSIIGNADMLNHAIPSTEELNSAMTKFLQAGILSVEQESFILSDSICSDIKAASAKRGGLFSLPDKGLKLLSKLKLEKQNQNKVDFSVTQVSEAVRKYSKSMKQSR